MLRVLLVREEAGRKGGIGVGNTAQCLAFPVHVRSRVHFLLGGTLAYQMIVHFFQMLACLWPVVCFPSDNGRYAVDHGGTIECPR